MIHNEDTYVNLENHSAMMIIAAETHAQASNMAKTVKKISQYCYQCVAGPDLLTVTVEDGVATEIEPNFAACDIHPGAGAAR